MIAGSEEAFVGLMNERAQQLEMTNTHFVNATGLDAVSYTHLDVYKRQARYRTGGI